MIEVKANGSQLNAGQQLGGQSHFGSVLDRMDTAGPGSGWRVEQHTGQGGPTRMTLDDLLDSHEITARDLRGAKYELWKYDNVDPDMAGPVSPPKRTDWTSGTNANEFELDVNNQRIQDTKNRRDWSGPGQRPE